MGNNKSLADEIGEPDTIADKAFSIIEWAYEFRKSNNSSSLGKGIPQRMVLRFYFETEGHDIQDITKGLDIMESRSSMELLQMGYLVGSGRTREGPYDPD